MIRTKLQNSLVALLGVGAGLAGVSCCLKHRKRLRLEFQKTCFYMAALDDEIRRRELEGMVIGKKAIVFPSRRETLSTATRFLGRCITTCLRKGWKPRWLGWKYD
jgi:hypothetical protein